MQNIALDTQNSISIFFGGDLCVDQPVEANFIDKQVISFTSKHDFRWCNFEAPIPTNESKKITKAGPHKSQDRTVSYLLDKNLFNICGLANNHIMDYGEDALNNTLKELKEREIEAHGAATNYNEAYEPLVIEKNGIRVALIALCENQFGCLDSDEHQCGYAWLFNPVIPDLIRSARDKCKCDFVIVLPHAGLEMYPFPLPEFRTYYKQLIDFGADLIVGNHPHVIQGKEEYKGKNIYYSLGNLFFNYKGKSGEEWCQGLGLSCQLSSDGTISIEEKIFTSHESKLCISDLNGSDLVKEKSKDFENEANYLRKVNDVTIDLWNNTFRAYSALPFLNGNYYKSNWFLKRMFYHFFNKFLSSENNTLLLHNYKIETNRFVIQRALKLLSKTY